MHFGGALVGEDGLEVVGMPDDGVLERDSVGAEDRAARTRDLDRFAGVVELAGADLFGPDLPAVLDPAELVGEEVALAHLERHVGDLGLGDLVAGQRLVEHLAGLRVLDGRLEAVAGGTLTINGTLNNNLGTLVADGGHLTVQGTLAAGGEADVVGSGVLEFGALSKAHVDFSGTAAGGLILDDASHFKGDIGGFADNDFIDLEDFLVGATRVTYGGYNATTDTTSLSFADTAHPKHTALLTFDGHYTQGELQIANDGNGHLMVQHQI